VRLAFLSLLAIFLAVPAAAQDGEPAGEQASAPPESAPAESAPAAESEPGYHVVVLSVGGDAPAGMAREAREAVATALARDGLRVLPEGDLALRFPPSRLRGCDSAACAWALGSELGVSMVAAVATWQQEGRAASITVSLVVGERRAHAASEDIGERTRAETAPAAVRGAQDARARALIVEGSAGASEPEPDEADERDTNAPVVEVPRARERSLEEYVLPGVLGAVGLALAASAVYALMPEKCSLTGASGVCLRGDAPNIGLGVVFAVTGGLSIAGAILWLVVGGMPAGMDRIDVVLGPDGGGLGWRGRF
jgi:hypothetical protein